MGLGRVGVKGEVSGQSRAAKVRATEDQGGQRPVAREPRAPRAPKGESECFVLRTYIVGGRGEKSYILIDG